MTEQRLLAALAEVADPEMPVNIVDLGLVYGVHEDGGRVSVQLTFTAMGCPAADFILADVREALMAVEGVREVEIEIVWDPPWSASLLTAEGRDALEMWGLAV